MGYRFSSHVSEIRSLKRGVEAESDFRDSSNEVWSLRNDAETAFACGGSGGKCQDGEEEGSLKEFSEVQLLAILHILIVILLHYQ